VFGVKLNLKELKIELTQQCPLACVHCSTNSNRKQMSGLSRTTVLRLLREAAELHVEKVVFTGGEPLVCEYLSDAVSAAAKDGISSTVYTSGITDNALSPMPFEMASRLVQRGLGRFIFSVYSHHPEVHDSVTRYGIHAATLAALKNAASTKCAVEIHLVAMKRNFRDLPGVVEMAASMGVQKVSVLRFVPQGRGEKISIREELVGGELKELADTIVALREQYPTVAIRAGSPFNILTIGHTPCNAAQDVLIVNHRGDIFPCDAFKNVHYVDATFGNILSQKLRDVWEQSLFLNRVRAVLREQKGETCRACELGEACQSGCLAQKVIRGGWHALQEPDPNCLVTPVGNRAMVKVPLVQIANSASH
jgi:radical SAM protein with 4Fe4S-binding SPASM domain